jgi:SagB-type dehydrogenase family enzyme
MLRYIVLAVVLLVAACRPVTQTAAPPAAPVADGALGLPTPVTDGQMSVEAALTQRRSVRAFETRPLTVTELGQLLWAAQGITDERGYRAAPSAGALYPLELYVATAGGLFHYEPGRHALTLTGEGDARPALYQAALRQEPVAQAPAVFVIAAVYERTAIKYGSERTPRYVHLEAGHAAQNLLLQAAALGLGAVPIGAFDDAGIQRAMGLPAEVEPLYLIPVGPVRQP